MTNPFRNFSIQRQLMLIIMLVSAVALLLACVCFVKYDTYTYRQELAAKLSSLAEVVGYNTVAALEFDDPAAARETLAALRGETRIVQAQLHQRTNSELFAAYLRPGATPVEWTPRSAQAYHEFTGDHLRLLHPITLGGEPVGSLELIADLGELHQRLWRQAGILLLVFAGAMVVAFYLSLHLGRMISQPVRHLAQVVQSVARDKNYSVRATKRSADELGQLIDGFNEMLAEIQHRDGALQAAREHLEQRVIERTEELAYERDLLRSLLDNSTDHIYFKDRQSHFIKSSSAQAAQFGVASAADLVGKSDFDFFAEAHAQPAFADEQEIIRTGRPMIDKVEQEIMKDGRVTWALTTKMPLRDKTGAIIGTFGISKNITAIKETEAQLVESRQFLQSTLDALTAHIAILDETGTVIAVNAMWKNFADQNQYLGNSYGIGANYLRLCESAVGACATESVAVAAGIRAVLTREKAEFHLEYPCHGPETERWFVVRVTRFEGAGPVRAVVAHENVTERKIAEAELQAAHRDLIEISRRAGMAEVATGVLHNVGNVLNSVNVAATCISEQFRKSKVPNLARALALLRENEAHLADYLTNDPKGQQLLPYLTQLTGHIAGEQTIVTAELEELRKHIEHIKDIVAMQQNFARVSGVTEPINVADLLDEAVRLNESSFHRHSIKIVKEFESTPVITIEKHKVLQILVNLMRNAKQACDPVERDKRQVTLRVMTEAGRVAIVVADNGVGIPPENLTRIFSHGFTTKKNGHGFGLHSGALAATEMGGALRVVSEGAGQGAVFTLELPVQPPRRTS